jgi:uncharacterized membrane protein YfcA
MIAESLLVLASGGLISGILAGLLGIGGGFIMVSLLIMLGYTPIQAVATSSLAIVITSTSGSIQNWRMGYFDLRRVLYLGLPALVTAQIGVHIATQISPYLLLVLFGVFLLVSIYLVDFRKRVFAQDAQGQYTFGQNRLSSSRVPRRLRKSPFNPILSRIGVGGITGVLTGLLGVGGGAIMVPLQMTLLGEPIKTAIQTSLGVLVATAVSACVGHAAAGNVLFLPGLILGTGGLLGVQISTRILPQLRDAAVQVTFRSFLLLISIYMFWQAWESYQSYA